MSSFSQHDKPITRERNVIHFGERERQRETERDRERQRETERKRERERERQRRYQEDNLFIAKNSLSSP